MRIHFPSTALAIVALVFAIPARARAEAAEATVVCKDGSSSKAGRGACRGHGGVDKAATAKASGGAAAAADAKGKDAAESVKKDQATATRKADEQTAETTVVCKDGSTARGGRGACRGHGGVDKTATVKGAGAAATSAKPAATPMAPPAATAPVAAPTARSANASRATAAPNAKNTDPTGAIAKCKDGTYSHAKGHTGACSRHGGVGEWLDKTEKK
jgi:hypothetical protein